MICYLYLWYSYLQPAPIIWNFYCHQEYVTFCSCMSRRSKIVFRNYVNFLVWLFICFNSQCFGMAQLKLSFYCILTLLVQNSHHLHLMASLQVLDKCQLQEVVLEKEKGLDSLGKCFQCLTLTAMSSSMHVFSYSILEIHFVTNLLHSQLLKMD